MFNKNTRRSSPAVNAGAMADIAFLLLIFFLVTTTIAQEQGVLVRLPAWIDEPLVATYDEQKVLTVKVNSQDLLLVEGKDVDLTDIPQMVLDHLNRPDFPAAEAIVSLTHDRSTSYDTYLQVYDALLAGYHQARDRAAQSLYGTTYEALRKERQLDIRKQYPLILSEAEPTEF